MSFQVPYRRKSEIESMSLDLLGKYQQWKGTTLKPPISIDEIIENFLSINLQFDNLQELLSMTDVLGATWFEEKIIRIDSSLEQNEGRLSFTMAHEIGHWWMHRPIYEMDKVTLPLFAYEKDKQPSPAVVCRLTKKREPAEWQADQFAAMLLMPESMMRKSFLSLNKNGPIEITDISNPKIKSSDNYELRDTARQLIKSCGFENVSIEAMCYRLMDLKLVVDSNSRQPSLF